MNTTKEMSLLAIGLMKAGLEDDEDPATYVMMKAIADLDDREWWQLVGALVGFARSSFEHHAENYWCPVDDLYEGLANQVLYGEDEDDAA